MDEKLQTVRGAIADLLNALDDARAVVTEGGEDKLDEMEKTVETLVRDFDRYFEEPAEERQRGDN